ncbi:MAG: type II toxin-antitoxin system Y4mF family antitoxin [Olegusella sp.]|nr:type II toxin-antitoxin system Y4mF family antitoxin [Olegusella sp.]
MDGYRVGDAAELGQLIRRVRKAQGFTQQELADGSGVGITFISNLEHGKGSSEFDKVVRVAQMLGIDIFARVRGEE